IAALGVVVLAYFPTKEAETEISDGYLPPEPIEATSAEVHQFCGACHAYPPPDTFPRAAWKKEVRQGYDFFRDSTLQIDYPSMESVIRYYEVRAPETLTVNPPQNSHSPLPVRFQTSTLPGDPFSAISNLNLVHLYDERKLDLLACDMRSGKIMVAKPYEQSPNFKELAVVPNPAHVEVVDLNGDGVKDILVASLGNFAPTDAKVGSVVWLKGNRDGTFTPVPLLEGVGRVADVQAGDFRGTGKLDLIVAVFGWRNTGEIIFLENQTTDWEHPKFVPHVLDSRHGAIHICVADLNGDGKLDFVALISQEHETIVAFLNEGECRFRKETIYTAPHPAYGSSGIQLVDLNGDGKLDVLYTNGDTLDLPALVKPYHGIQWLENKGKYPFEHHQLASMPGAMRAVAVDMKGSGKKDVVAVSFLAKENFPDREERNLDSIIFLEQIRPGEFVRHSLEKGTCDHMTCVAGAWNGDDKMHLAVGNFALNRKFTQPAAVTFWKSMEK
ncbi:MAG TPA: FG-GAP-like repeat-containing protein, partial [Gemmataceae bacterium]|nr:FG-GAP-like repeat-containing protein [Gemmataceae bacterium]